MKIYQLNWDVLDAAEKVGKLPLNMPVPQALLRQIYRGDAQRLMGEGKQRTWSVTMTAKAKALNGEIHTHVMNFKTEQKVNLNTLINHVKHRWLDEVDNDLADMDCISVEAIARTRR